MRPDMTREMRERDYEYLWALLNAAFPLRGAMERLGYDWDRIKSECREPVVEAQNDLEFCRALDKVFERFDHFAHTNLINAYMYKSYREFFQKIADGKTDSSSPEGQGAWIRALSHPRSGEFYSIFDDTPASGRGFYLKGQAPEKGGGAMPPAGDRPRAACLMLPERVAYIRVPTVRMEQIPLDRPVLFDFYKKTGSCRHLILDFRGNGGGATDYWGKLIVSPIIKEELTEHGRMLYDINDFNRDFIEDGLGEHGEFSGEQGSPEELFSLPNFHREYLSQASRLFKFKNTYRPDPEHRFEVEKKIWLLTDKRVYSSAEGFAKFCKSTGWASIVGERTGGDGGSMTPSFGVLPESGLVVRYKGVNNINADGGSNAEFHTEPDIVCEPESALARCLSQIELEG